MEYLQYLYIEAISPVFISKSFKPYYKWNTFNTLIILRRDGGI